MVEIVAGGVLCAAVVVGACASMIANSATNIGLSCLAVQGACVLAVAASSYSLGRARN